MKLPKTIFMGVISLLLLFIFSSGALASETATDTHATVEFVEGILTFDSFPDLDFGTQKFSYNNKSYELSTPSSPEVQVTDDRSTAPGWELTLKADTFKNDLKTLIGATITFSNGDVQPGPDLGSDFNALKPTVQNITVSANGSSSGIDVMTAALGSGRGTWKSVWVSTNVKLFAPGGKMEAGVKYTTTLTWTLIDGPIS